MAPPGRKHRDCLVKSTVTEAAAKGLCKRVSPAGIKFLVCLIIVQDFSWSINTSRCLQIQKRSFLRLRLETSVKQGMEIIQTAVGRKAEAGEREDAGSPSCLSLQMFLASP